MTFQVAGWASTPDLDSVRDVVLPSAFSNSIADRGLTGSRSVKHLWQHDRSKPLGPITKLEVRNQGLWIEATISPDISWGKDAIAVLQSVGPMSFSIGYRILSADIAEDVQGREYLVLTELDLFEVSIVTVPANEAAIMTFAGAPDPMASALTAAQELKTLFGPKPDDPIFELRGHLAQLKAALRT